MSVRSTHSCSFTGSASVAVMASSDFVQSCFSNRHRAVVLLVTLHALLLIVGTISPLAVRADDLCQAIITTQLGYPCRSLTAETPDGFILGMYNIPRGRADAPDKSPGTPVLLVHGYTAGGDNFVLNSAEESLATYLADHGFDVWIGNNRNIQWSHGSSKYSTSDKGYWDWTWDELAAYDVPTMIQYVYSTRGNTKLFYVGHSQGTLTLFASLTNTPQLTLGVSSKLRGAMLLAPFAYNANIQPPLQRLIVQSYADIIPPALNYGPLDVALLVQTICMTSTEGCNNLIEGQVGQNSYVNETRVPFYLQYFPQVTSTYNLNHFGQTFRSGLFQKYSKGLLSNFMIYGRDPPPLYNFSLFPPTLPVQLLIGGIDGLADPIDVQHTIDNLPKGNLVVQRFPTYGHLDFVIGYQAYVDVYPQMVSFMGMH